MDVKEIKVNEIDKKLEELEQTVEELRKIIVRSRLKCLSLKEDLKSIERATSK